MAVRWSYGSQVKLDQLDSFLLRVVERVRDKRDVSIVTAHRGEQEQDAHFNAVPQRSKVQWPNSKHNQLPSLAVDVQPYPYVEDSLREDLSYIAGLFIAFAEAEGGEVRWGGDWDKDGETNDNSFDDLFHFEVARAGRDTGPALDYPIRQRAPNRWYDFFSRFKRSS